MIDTLTLQITDRCNLACTYCVVSKEQVGDINESMLRRCVDLYLNGLGEAAGYVTITGAGEPLLRPDLVYEVFSQVQSRRHAARLRLVTNGVLLTSAVAERLAAFRNLHCVISCDGPKDLHDSNRPFADGSGSYDSVMSGVMYARSAGLSVELRAVATNHTVSRIGDVLSHNSHKGTYPCKVRPIGVGLRGDRTTVSDVDVYTDGYIAYLDTLLAGARDAERPMLPADVIAWVRRLHSSDSHQTYCTAGHTGVCLGPQGHIYVCELFTDSDFCLGHIEEMDDEAWKQMHTSPAMALVRANNPRAAKRCRNCECRKVCCGGCPALNTTIFDPLAVHPLCRHFQRFHKYVESKLPQLMALLDG
jgi:uncharacterized protein